jgi:hypothetical protein
VGAVKIYVAAVDALKEKGKPGMKHSFTTKNLSKKTSLGPSYFAL